MNSYHYVDPYENHLNETNMLHAPLMDTVTSPQHATVDERIFRRPFGFGRPFFGRPFFGRPYGFGFGAPFYGGFLGGLTASTLFGPYGYGYGYGYPYSPYGGYWW